MQTVNHDGILGAIKEYSPDALAQALKQQDVAHVDVFEGTPENLAHRQSLIGKKYQVKKTFQKTGGNKPKVKNNLDLEIKIYGTSEQIENFTNSQYGKK